MPSRQEADLRHARHYIERLEAVNQRYERSADDARSALLQFDQDWNQVKTAQLWAASTKDANRMAAMICSGFPAVAMPVLDVRLHPDELIRWLEQALDAGQKGGLQAYGAMHLSHLGIAWMHKGDYQRAISCLEHSLAIDGDERSRATDYGNLGLIYNTLGDYQRAFECLERAFAVATQLGDQRAIATWANDLGNTYSDRGQFQRAIDSYEQSLIASRASSYRRNEGNVLGNLGNAHLQTGNFRLAVEYLEKALAIGRELGDKQNVCHNLGNLGSACLELGDTDRAEAAFHQSLTFSREIGNRRLEAK